MGNFKTFMMLLSVALSAGCAQITIGADSGCLTLGEAHHVLKVPGECGKTLAGEGHEICIAGYIDSRNVFDKSHYPRLPYEKFVLHDDQRDYSIEVWVESPESSLIFDKIHRQKDLDRTLVYVTGTVSGFDMPVMERCTRGFKIILSNASHVRFSR